MVSVERIKQFTKIPSESAWEIKGNLPSPNWPTRGDISIQDLKVSYSGVLPGTTHLGCNFRSICDVSDYHYHSGLQLYNLACQFFHRFDTGRILLWFSKASHSISMVERKLELLVEQGVEKQHWYKFSLDLLSLVVEGL